MKHNCSRCKLDYNLGVVLCTETEVPPKRFPICQECFESYKSYRDDAIKSFILGDSFV